MITQAFQPAAPPALPEPVAEGDRHEELASIIAAYNAATENLLRSHDALRHQVGRLQHQLASTDAQLQRSRRLAALGEMAAGIAHEIRNPLAAIHLYAGMLADDLQQALHASLPPGQAADPDEPLALWADTAGKIAQAVRGLNAVVGDVLSFARELRPRCKSLPAAAVLERAAEAHRPAITAACVDLQVIAPVSLQLHADPDLLHQALLNLVRNAVDALQERAQPRTLILEAQQADAAVRITVRDNGTGIADEHIDRIFNPFFTTRSTGTGLGLAIVHRIVDAHGGTIAVHNDGGAVFELLIPPSPGDTA